MFLSTLESPFMSSTPDTRLIWIDLEMTGLDTDNDKIIEIATIITDDNLNILAEGPVLAVHQSDLILNAMDEWNTNQHGLSGLTEEVSNSNITEQMAEIETLDFVSKYVGENTSPMCGNTVSHDRRFLSKYMPRLESYFNYRHIDVSSFKEVAVRWMNEAQVYEKKGSHRALGDIKESVEELKFYKKLFFPE